ncbi:hypothetical protein JV16_02828 [Anoxybacillus ayderensis]|uniref:DUF4305 domain-containing protein n=2 Tax=Anoxybacillus TaxID=150247 RepID=A0A0D0HL40_9BACL|nr:MULTISPECIES: YdiK family protein [Anoxybacillus]EMT44807.1 hypothetical protein H919_13410 [Anoxybacillus flavithermus AK1]KIP20017.1 hypothetical protein JV16_02828 [Anoxybacillus ayderensis]QAV25332.1 DUF4305 domain-containing protein [Neobacillus thermocopriae]
MKYEPLFYFLMGILFTYFAVDSAEDGIWDVTTMLFIMIATFDFGTAIRSLFKKTSRS